MRSLLSKCHQFNQNDVSNELGDSMSLRFQRHYMGINLLVHLGISLVYIPLKFIKNHVISKGHDPC